MNNTEPKKDAEKKEEFDHNEQNWENPVAPEHADDQRSKEQLLRQKKAAEIRKENLSDDGDS